MNQADVAVIGAGIAGLAHAYEAARRGYKVVLFERHPRAWGASGRNFGLILPLGLATGLMRLWARRSRKVWRQLAEEAGFWLDPTGVLVAAYHDDELAVLHEFVEQTDRAELPCHLLNKLDALTACRVLRREKLRGGLFSPTSLVIDPREVMVSLPAYLARAYGVTLCYGQAVTEVELPYLQAGGDIWRVERAIVCCGSDFETLYPDLFCRSDLTRCKLQMLRTEPQPDAWRLGPAVMTGLSLKHYPAFATCPSLSTLKQRLAADYPMLEQWGIHLLAVQNGSGEVILGDSHEYGLAPDPFDRTEVEELIVAHLRQTLDLPSFYISHRWHGIYAKHQSQDFLIAAPEPDVRVVAGLGGAGMTISFGLAQDLFEYW
ncbi:MAG TPA: TIGR03364 family FAD-dependent oxidoreductase [Anaerolineae bacterium]|nr:TIGR03364 family FAD-dependent oxidoreductase [Anaerolineae bacterium]